MSTPSPLPAYNGETSYHRGYHATPVSRNSQDMPSLNYGNRDDYGLSPALKDDE